MLDETTNKKARRNSLNVANFLATHGTESDEKGTWVDKFIEQI